MRVLILVQRKLHVIGHAHCESGSQMTWRRVACEATVFEICMSTFSMQARISTRTVLLDVTERGFILHGGI